jgi:hypothetical protein
MKSSMNGVRNLVDNVSSGTDSHHKENFAQLKPAVGWTDRVDHLGSMQQYCAHGTLKGSEKSSRKHFSSQVQIN